MILFPGGEERGTTQGCLAPHLGLTVMAGGICAGRAVRMSSHGLHLKSMNRGFFSQDTRGSDIPYLRVVRCSCPLFPGTEETVSALILNIVTRH